MTLESGYSGSKGASNPKRPVNMGIWLNMLQYSISKGFLDSLAGKESACNAGDPGSIPGSRSSPREGIGYLLQYSWASLVAETVKNPPAMRETWV